MKVYGFIIVFLFSFACNSSTLSEQKANNIVKRNYESSLSDLKVDLPEYTALKYIVLRKGSRLNESIELIDTNIFVFNFKNSIINGSNNFPKSLIENKKLNIEDILVLIDKPKTLSERIINGKRLKSKMYYPKQFFEKLKKKQVGILSYEDTVLLKSVVYIGRYRYDLEKEGSDWKIKNIFYLFNSGINSNSLHSTHSAIKPSQY